MNKAELVEATARQAGTTKKDADAILTAALDVIMTAVSTGDKVTLVGFGSFEARHRKGTTGRDPRSGKQIDIPARTVPAFSAGKVFKEKV